MDNIVQISYKYYNESLKLAKSGFISKARDLLSEGLKFNSNDIEILNLMGHLEYLLCNFDRAYFYWNESVKINDSYNKALSYIKKLKSDDFKELLLLYNNSIKFAKDKNFNKAIELLEQIIVIDKNLIEPYYIIGLCYIELKKYKKALLYFNKLNELDKENYKYLNYIDAIKNINYKTTRKRYIGIIGLFSSVSIIATSVLVSNNKQLSLKYEDMDLYYKDIIKQKEEENKQITSKLESQEINDFKLNESKEIFSSIEIDISKEIFKNSYNYYKKGNYNEAIKGFKYIYNHCKNENYILPEAIYFMACSYEKLNKDDLAIKYYEIYIQKYINGDYYDESLYNMGLIFYDNGNIKNAKNVLYKLKQEKPDSIYINSKVNSILEN